MSQSEAAGAAPPRRLGVDVVLTALVYLAALCGVAFLAFVIVIVLAGPHAGLLPQFMEGVILVAGWLAVLALPPLIARKVWRRRRATARQ